MPPFVDRVRILAKAGDGGRGCVSFRREPHIPYGGPDGGKGGRGGHVILKVNPHLNNLYHLKLTPHHRAQNGQAGGSGNCTGRNGADTIIEVPPGTVVSLLGPPPRHAPASEERLAPLPPPRAKLTVIADLTQPYEEFILCHGGRGGRGNASYKTPTHQAPREYEEGQPGEVGQFVLELKSIADVGLVGYPNAGKSSLLAALSRAHPKIAPYPFSTLTPQIGVLETPGTSHPIVIADIPGLIEGAHQGVGLGHEFLRHIERCRMLIILIDIAATEGRDPAQDYATLRKELKLYSPSLAEKPFLIVANKIDLPEAAHNLTLFRKKIRRRVFPLSTLTREGIPKLIEAIVQQLRQIDQAPPAAPLPNPTTPVK
ncbi:MAG: GTPase ObgE [Methylacidiphilales bacterium]|nr:GTPase ObgE [Candidatus Methylacidiphilales bacterium]MDW8349064.1 GTPase ObgE [Verrucomicrobiae bacterium]